MCLCPKELRPQTVCFVPRNQHAEGSVRNSQGPLPASQAKDGCGNKTTPASVCICWPCSAYHWAPGSPQPFSLALVSRDDGRWAEDREQSGPALLAVADLLGQALCCDALRALTCALGSSGSLEPEWPCMQAGFSRVTICIPDVCLRPCGRFEVQVVQDSASVMVHSADSVPGWGTERAAGM